MYSWEEIVSLITGVSLRVSQMSASHIFSKTVRTESKLGGTSTYILNPHKTRSVS